MDGYVLQYPCMCHQGPGKANDLKFSQLQTPLPFSQAHIAGLAVNPYISAFHWSECHFPQLNVLGTLSSSLAHSFLPIHSDKTK